LINPHPLSEIIMNKLLIILFSALALGSTLPAFADSGAPATEQAGNTTQTAPGGPNGDVHMASASASAGAMKCAMPDRLAVLLDHGPRAVTTPYLNQQRKARYDAQVKACMEASK
jgi:hypothetical protein